MSTPRVAIVTGAAQGLGRAIVLKLADDGFDVAVNDIPSKLTEIKVVVRMVEEKGRKAIAIPADVSSEHDVKFIIEKTVLELGSLDTMVANAGIVVMKPLMHTSVEEYERLMSVNCRGVMLCFKYAAMQMIKQGKGGRIIGASSIAGKRGLPNISAYSMSKFSVRGLVQSLAQELKPYDIRVNAYAPGTIQTDLKAHAEKITPDGFTIHEMIGLPANTPLGASEDVASLVGYLVKPESAFINGQTITTDGGVIFD